MKDREASAIAWRRGPAGGSRALREHLPRDDSSLQRQGSNSKLKTLERVLSKVGLGSRSEARSWIHARRVSVNGRVVENPDQWIDPARDKVEFDGVEIRRKRQRYVLLYKPTGYLTTYRDPEGRKTVYDLLGEVDEFVAPVGRLDKDTSGLLILTNDTQFAERLTNPEYHVEKTYLVKCASLLSDEALQALRDGVELEDGPTRPAEAKRIRDTAVRTFLELTLTEGRNRQVRRMIEAVGSRVLKLVRLRIGTVGLGALQIGDHRELTPDEVRMLKRESHAGERKRSSSLREGVRGTGRDRQATGKRGHPPRTGAGAV
jgi:23S rRNA pseudouridine2605 synthase